MDGECAQERGEDPRACTQRHRHEFEPGSCKPRNAEEPRRRQEGSYPGAFRGVIPLLMP